ncbi:MAG: SCO family protein [Acidobacteriaceae bacterium]
MALGCALLCLAGSAALAQSSWYGEKHIGPTAEQQPPMLKHITIAQRLNQPIPLNLEFRDETGKLVHLGDYFGKRPVILSLVYYQCKILCPEEMGGLVSALEMVKFNPGRDFNVVFVSIDPTETPAMAASEKALYVKRYGRPGTANGWHFLTGQEPAINALATAVGFGYVKVQGPDGKLSQYAHASAIELLTPQGRLSQYYLGVEFSPKDIDLGLVEAGQGTIGSPVDNILTYCYRYDPALNRHSLLVSRIVQAGCLLTMLLLGSYMLVNFRRDIREARLNPLTVEQGRNNPMVNG